MTTDKQIEELLKPRYKVIADWPGNVLPIGTIYKHETIGILNPKKCDDFPHLFKKLAWYEERKPEEMPEYVKTKGRGKVIRVTYWTFCVFWTCKDVDSGNHYMQDDVTPSTREEYDNYQHSKPQTI